MGIAAIADWSEECAAQTTPLVAPASDPLACRSSETTSDERKTVPHAVTTRLPVCVSQMFPHPLGLLEVMVDLATPEAMANLEIP